MNLQWTIWHEDDEIPETGPYWVTAGGIDGPETYKELLGPWEHRSWRYNGVTAFQKRVDGYPKPEPYAKQETP